MKTQRSSSGAGGAHIGMFGRSLMLCAAEDKGGSGGGGGEGGDDKKPDPAMVAAIAEALGSKINAAVSDHLKRAKKDQDKAIQDGIKAALDAAGVKPKAEGGEGGGEGGEGGAGGEGQKLKGDPTLQAEIEKMRKDLDKYKKETESEKAKRIAAETKAQRDEERALLTKLLGGEKNNGRPLVRAEVMDDVAELLSRKLVRNPDNPDEILWKSDKWSDREGADNSENYEQLDAGFSKWAESPKGKAYAPPAQVGGGGFGAPRTGITPKGKGDEVASDAEIGQFIYSGGGRR